MVTSGVSSLNPIFDHLAIWKKSMSNISALIQQLEAIPAFSGFKKSLKENLKPGNFYVDHCMPESEGYFDDRDDDGKQAIHKFCLSETDRGNQAIDNLLDEQQGYFDEFIHGSDLSNDITELMRAIIKECRKCKIC